MIVFDADRLFEDLDKLRQEREMSWRALAKTCAVSPSTFTRMSYSNPPSADGLVRLMKWLGTSDLSPYIKEDTE